MTTIYLPPPTVNEIRLPILVRELSIVPQLQSQERQKLAEVTEEIWQTLTTSEKELDNLAEDQEIQYNPVPPKRTFTVKVRYRFNGRMKPQSYSLDDE
ncbi:MAG: hypothetical protein MUC48_21165 [Leptolyngbya sp. Prado105]|jgi:hypothetical protein|nr:hypothetical protein [Leptolyngbya sp. Prado105]